MKRHLSFRISFLALFSFVLTEFAFVFASQTPNIIFFLSDDHRSDFLGCAGNGIVQTPRLDQLAAEGVRFNNAFVTTSICAASRASLFTGLVERSHRYTFGTPPIAKDLTDRSYVQLLRKAGYHTGFVGKFGVGVESGVTKEMFDSFVPLNRNPYFKKQPDGSTRHVTEIAGDRAIEFIRNREKETPFCLSVSFNAAHAEDSDKNDHFPWPKAENGLYENEVIPPPRLSQEEDFESQPDFLKGSLNRLRYFWRWDTYEKYQKNVKAYYRMITGLDRVIGRVLDELKSQGLSENTVVIFAGDNGYYKGSRGFAGKWSHYEESLRVPMIVFDPRLETSLRGRIVERMALNIDLPATMLEYGEVPVPATYQGRSLVQLMEGTETEGWRKDFFCEHLFDRVDIPKWEGVRGQRWVYARYFQQEPVFEFLHDLSTDPLQRKNLAKDPSFTSQLSLQRARCDDLREIYGGEYSLDKIPTVRYLKSQSEVIR